jgi:hypothetical protein
MSSTAPTRDPSAPGLAGKVALWVWLVIAPVIALALAALFLATSGDLHGLEATYPRGLAVLVALLAIVSIRRDAAEARRDRLISATAVDSDVEPVDTDAGAVDLEGRRGVGMATGRTLAFVAVLVVTTWLMGTIGFFPAATLLILGGLVVLGVRSPLRVASYTVGVVAIAYLLFVEALGVRFPSPWS